MDSKIIITTEQQLTKDQLKKKYTQVRQHTVAICQPLQTEDYVVQPTADVSPPKWHLGHSTWFFETFMLQPHFKNYVNFDPNYNFVFNSYYESVGNRVIRTDRGNLSRPSVKDIYRYREYVDDHMSLLLENIEIDSKLLALLALGINHEQQHQELLYTDIKYILGHNPLFPAYDKETVLEAPIVKEAKMLSFAEGVYEIGFKGKGFCFDNELGVHKVFLNDFQISSNLVSNAEYLEFIQSGGYEDFSHWHSEGWDWVKQQNAAAPLYWHYLDNTWMNYSYGGLSKVIMDQPVCHVNFYEASAYASWKGLRLPTEAEWEIAAGELDWGQRWEWTNSAYLPYPGFSKAPGAIGEYNGKFMVNQMVLRGASVVTPKGHERATYRNFFHPKHQWQFSGIRLAK